MIAPSAGGWTFDTLEAPAGELHARSAARIATGAEPPLQRAAWVLKSARPAVVLGSAEPLGHIDAAAVQRAGVELVRRRSGGGAVLVGPGRCLWVDLVIGRNDPLWDDDIGRAVWWVGDLWVEALRAVGVDHPTSWRGPLVRSEWSDRACFAGLGPGEVTVRENKKVVGVSQRRTRAGALFQCAALLDAGPSAGDGLAELVGFQTLSTGQRAGMLAQLRRGTFPLPQACVPALVDALRSLLDAA